MVGGKGIFAVTNEIHCFPVPCYLDFHATHEHRTVLINSVFIVVYVVWKVIFDGFNNETPFC